MTRTAARARLRAISALASATASALSSKTASSSQRLPVYLRTSKLSMAASASRGLVRRPGGVDFFRQHDLPEIGCAEHGVDLIAGLRHRQENAAEDNRRAEMSGGAADADRHALGEDPREIRCRAVKDGVFGAVAEAPALIGHALRTQILADIEEARFLGDRIDGDEEAVLPVIAEPRRVQVGAARIASVAGGFAPMAEDAHRQPHLARGCNIRSSHAVISCRCRGVCHDIIFPLTEDYWPHSGRHGAARPLTRSSEAPSRRMPSRLVPVKSESSSLVSRRSAPLRSACAKSQPLRSACRHLAPERLARMNLARSRFEKKSRRRSPTSRNGPRLTPDRLAPLRWARCSVAPRISASVRTASRRSAAERSHMPSEA